MGCNKKTELILIDALYINNSGGKALLDCLVDELESRKFLTPYYLLDQRIGNEYVHVPESRKCFVSPSFLKRHFFYEKHRKSFDKILCFGNLPPSIKLDVEVYTYFHNVLFFDVPDDYPLKQKISKWIKGCIVKYFSQNTTFFWVQSNQVKKLIKNNIRNAQVDILPFYRNIEKNCTRRKKGVFCYVSNGNAHKNHHNLIEAWKIVNVQRPDYQLHLTVTNDFPRLLDKIEGAISNGVNIINHGWVDSIELFSTCEAQIYPSLKESFGLGLVEAVQSGCDVVAANLPYVREVISPSGYFDPLNVHSITNAVLSYSREDILKRSIIVVENSMPEIIKILTD